MPSLLGTPFVFEERTNPNGLPCLKGYNIINGELKDASDGKRFDSVNPALTNDLVGNFPASTKDDVNEALDVAKTKLDLWANTPAPSRGQIIGNMGRLLIQYKDEIVRLETREIGKTLKESGGTDQEAIDT